MSRASWLHVAGLPAAFWAALFVLVANDHVLKGSGLVPSVITGKLSDFAGLIVAPILLCAAFSARTERARGLWIGLVAAGFAAIKLSPALADAAGQLLTWIGIPSRIWCDPTDLVAFAVLPLSAMLARRVQPMPARLSRRFAIGVASLACLATSEDGPHETELRAPFLINWTQSEIEVRVTRSIVACDGSEDGMRQEVVQRYRLGPAKMSPLGRSLGSDDAAAGPCTRLDIEIDDATQRITWPQRFSEPIQRDILSSNTPDQDYVDIFELSYDDDWAFESGVTVYGSASSPRFELGTLLEGVQP
jgi:hypothetical protein